MIKLKEMQLKLEQSINQAKDGTIVTIKNDVAAVLDALAVLTRELVNEVEQCSKSQKTQ